MSDFIEFMVSLMLCCAAIGVLAVLGLATGVIQFNYTEDNLDYGTLLYVSEEQGCEYPYLIPERACIELASEYLSDSVVSCGFKRSELNPIRYLCSCGFFNEFTDYELEELMDSEEFVIEFQEECFPATDQCVSNWVREGVAE